MLCEAWKCGGGHTVNARFDGSLDGPFKNRPVPPHLDNPAYLVLDIGCGTFVCNGSSLRHNRRKRKGKVILMTSLGLLNNLCKKNTSTS